MSIDFKMENCSEGMVQILQWTDNALRWMHFWSILAGCAGDAYDARVSSQRPIISWWLAHCKYLSPWTPWFFFFFNCFIVLKNIHIIYPFYKIPLQTSPNMFVDGSMIEPENSFDTSSHQVSFFYFSVVFLASLDCFLFFSPFCRVSLQQLLQQPLQPYLHRQR